VYEWAGCNPLPPMFWLLPKFFPMHPGPFHSIIFYGKHIS